LIATESFPNPLANAGGFFVLKQPRNKVTKQEKTLFLGSFCCSIDFWK
jgi:hypothetical protein